LQNALPANGPREHYMRARLEVDADAREMVQVFSDQDSSLVSVFVAANALVCRPPDAPASAVGAMVDVLPMGGA
jgi:molybdopterin molybdotransferase